MLLQPSDLSHMEYFLPRTNHLTLTGLAEEVNTRLRALLKTTGYRLDRRGPVSHKAGSINVVLNVLSPTGVPAILKFGPEIDGHVHDRTLEALLEDELSKIKISPRVLHSDPEYMILEKVDGVQHPNSHSDMRKIWKMYCKIKPVLDRSNIHPPRTNLDQLDFMRSLNPEPKVQEIVEKGIDIYADVAHKYPLVLNHGDYLDKNILNHMHDPQAPKWIIDPLPVRAPWFYDIARYISRSRGGELTIQQQLEQLHSFTTLPREFDDYVAAGVAIGFLDFTPEKNARDLQFMEQCPTFSSML